MGLVKICISNKYWSTKSIYDGFWASAIMPRIRFTSLMVLLHVVDPGVEDPGDKLRKVGVGRLLIILNLGALICISPDNNLLLMSVW